MPSGTTNQTGQMGKLSHIKSHETVLPTLDHTTPSSSSPVHSRACVVLRVISISVYVLNSGNSPESGPFPCILGEVRCWSVVAVAGESTSQDGSNYCFLHDRTIQWIMMFSRQSSQEQTGQPQEMGNESMTWVGGGAIQQPATADNKKLTHINIKWIYWKHPIDHCA